MDIVLRHISKAYGEQIVLKDFSAVFPEGKVTGIMAPSGRGKTTLLRILMDLEQADSGSVEGVLGKKRSAVFQEDRLCDNLSAMSNIRLAALAHSREDIMQAMEAIGLGGCATQPVRELSGGMSRRVAILRALLAEYDILYLDEPFRGLDADTRASVMEFTRQKCLGKTVLLVTHDEKETEAMGACSICRLP